MAQSPILIGWKFFATTYSYLLDSSRTKKLHDCNQQVNRLWFGLNRLRILLCLSSLLLSRLTLYPITSQLVKKFHQLVIWAPQSVDTESNIGWTGCEISLAGRDKSFVDRHCIHKVIIRLRNVLYRLSKFHGQ